MTGPGLGPALRGSLLLAAGRRRGAEGFAANPAALRLGLAMLAITHVAGEVHAAGAVGLPPGGSVPAWAAITLALMGAYVAVSWRVAARLGLAAHWTAYLGAWSWQQAMLGLLALPMVGALGAPILADAWWLAILPVAGFVAYALWLGWFTAVAVLGAPAGPAAGLVVLELAIVAGGGFAIEAVMPA